MKYNYTKVIQQQYSQGWEDVSEYETNSQGVPKEQSGHFTTLRSGRKVPISLLKHDLREYRLTGYPTRVISRREKI